VTIPAARPTIVQINLSPTLGGAEVYTAFMSRALTARGWPTRVLVDAHATIWRDLDFGGVELVPVTAATAPAKIGEGDIALIHGSIPENLLDALRAGRQHRQPIETERDAARSRHLGERGQKILVHRITLAMDALLLTHSRFKARALLGHIGEFAERIGQFHPAGIELEALRHLGAAGLGARQRRQRQRVLI